MQSLYRFQGVVQEGKKRGKRLGFPTINVSLQEVIPEGIYVSHIQIAGIFYQALTFIGAAKTYNETEVLAETFVFDFSQEVYGQAVEIVLLHKLRENQKFVSEELLIEQMKEDKKKALEYFQNS